MRVALLVGMLLVNVLVGFYEIGWIDTGSVDTAGDVRCLDDAWPPPPSWP